MLTLRTRAPALGLALWSLTRLSEALADLSPEAMLEFQKELRRRPGRRVGKRWTEETIEQVNRGLTARVER